MHWLHIAKSWPDYLPVARSHWSRLTTYDLTVTVGRRDLLLRKLQDAYGLSEEEADRQIEQWQFSLDGSVLKS